ncbi:hypothetical protein FML20_23705 [Klebsiella michiganensis]|nr:hypothetical protein [Klebsiella michiganensis]
MRWLRPLTRLHSYLCSRGFTNLPPACNTNYLGQSSDAGGVSCPQFFAESLICGHSAKKNTICLPDLMRFGEQRGAVACPGTDKERYSWKIQPACCDV